MDHWVDVTADGRTVRHALKEGLTRLGGSGCDVPVPGARDELHLWSDPPKVIHAGQSDRPLLDGRAFQEAHLEPGASLQWGPAVLVYGREEAVVVEETAEEEELPAAPGPRPAGGTGGGTGGGGDTFQHRLLAGILADLRLVNRREVKRWQDAVVRGQFDPDACARELVTADAPGPDDPRVLERAGRLQRDLLMMPLQRGVRGTGRRARAATRKGTAYVLANLVAISIYSLVLVAIMILVRLNYDFSFDRVIDGILDLFR